MNEITDKEIDLKALEKKVYSSFFEDGLWDLFFGMIFLGFGFNWLGEPLGIPEPLDDFIIYAIWMILPVSFFILGKKYITIPRIGFVKFGEKRKTQRKRLLVFFIINLGIGIIFALLPITGLFRQLPFSELAEALFIGFVFITIPLSVIALILQFKRLYIWALICGFCFFLSELLYPLVGGPFDSLIAFLVIGGSIVITGLVYLIKFLKKYPKTKTDAIT